MKFSEEKEKQIVSMYLSGKNQKEIATHFQTFNTSIRRVLMRNGISIVSLSERLRAIPPTVFDDYTDKEVQYWLGVIASDGCLTSGKLVVETKDKDWMEDYKNFLNPRINLNVTQPKRGNTLYRVQVRSKGLKENLEKYGLTENKSLTLFWKFPLTKDFVRGVFDGDGCVVFTEKTKTPLISFCGGSLIFLEQIQHFLKDNSIYSKMRKVTREGKILYYLCIHNIEDKKAFFNLIYSNTGSYLKRKKEKFSNIWKTK